MSFNLQTASMLLAMTISVIALIKGVYEYAKAQKWKKAEFVAKEIKEFLNDFDVKRAFLLLDWNAYECELLPKEIEGQTKLKFNDELVFNALRTHIETDRFTKEEVVVKLIFDRFFDKLSVFNQYIESGLIKPEDIRPYLVYWIQLIADKNNKRKSAEVREQIWQFIVTYGFQDVIDLCGKFGYTIKA